MDWLWQDVRFALRQLRQEPSFACASLLALALGTGVTSAVFTVVEGVVLRPLPYPDPEELVAVFDVQPEVPRAPASFAKYSDWRDRNQVFDALGGVFPETSNLTGSDEPERIRTALTSATLFRVLQIPPLLDAGPTMRKTSREGRRSSC